MSQAPSIAPLQLVPETFGTLLVGTWLNAVLLTFEATQVFRYFTASRLFPSGNHKYIVKDTVYGRWLDCAWVRVLVLWMFTLDIISSGAACAMAYTYTVTRWDDISALLANDWIMSIFGVATALCILSMNLFLVARYYDFSQCAILSIFLSVHVLVAFALFLFISISIPGLYWPLGGRASMRTLVVTWLIYSGSTNCLIVVALMLILARIWTAIDDTQGPARMITWLIRINLLSGAGPTLLTLICLIGFVCSPDINISLTFIMSLGRTATLTVLYNLNSRDYLASSTRQVSQATVDRSVHTLVEPRQMHAKGWPSMSAGSDQPTRSMTAVWWCEAGTIGQATTFGSSPMLVGVGPGSKLPIDLEAAAETCSSGDTIGGRSFAKSLLPTPDAIVGDIQGGQTADVHVSV